MASSGGDTLIFAQPRYDLQGIRGLEMQLRSADPRAHTIAIRAVAKATRIVYNEAIQNAPFETGDLIQGMDHEVFRPRTQRGFVRYRYEGRITWNHDAVHGLYQERGTGIHGPSGLPYFQRTRDGAGYFLHPGIPAIRYVQRAVIVKEPQVIAIFRRAGRDIARHIEGRVN